LIITTTKEVGQITESQVVECLDYYYYEDTSGGAYVRSLFGDNILGPDQFDSESFRTIPNVIARLLDEPVGLNDAYSISLPGDTPRKIFDQKTGNKNYITIPPDLLQEDYDKKLACLIFVFILFSIVGTKIEDKYTSFDFSANIALRTDPPPPLNRYTSDVTVTSTNQDTGETTTTPVPNLYNNQGFINDTMPELKLMATAFYPEQPNDTRHSLYIFKHTLTLTDVKPFVSTDPNAPALFCIDLTKVNQDILSNTTNLRVNDANTTVESMLGYQKNGDAGYLMAVITNKNVQETTVE
jgi:hypothetical protein